MSISTHNSSPLSHAVNLTMPQKSQFQESVFQDSVLIETDDKNLSAKALGSGIARGEMQTRSALDDEETFTIPLFGMLSTAKLSRKLYRLLSVLTVIIIGWSIYSFYLIEEAITDHKLVDNILRINQQLAKEADQAVLGDLHAFESLQNASNELSALGKNIQSQSTKSQGPVSIDGLINKTNAEPNRLLERITQSAVLINSHKVQIEKNSELVKFTNDQTSAISEQIQHIVNAIQKLHVSPNAIEALNNLNIVSQGISEPNSPRDKSFESTETIKNRLKLDRTLFEFYTNSLLNGNEDLHIPATKDPEVREQLIALSTSYQDQQRRVVNLQETFAALVAVRRAQENIHSDGALLKESLMANATSMASGNRYHVGHQELILLLGAVLLLTALAQISLQRYTLKMQRERVSIRLMDAQKVGQTTNQANQAIQAAILRLMNELQAVAEGDLTRQATVTEDITGAIADSVNYTVEELRGLVTHVQVTADKVAHTTAQVGTSSKAQMTTFNQQLRQIRQTGLSVLEMASRINSVSKSAQESADVARQSLLASNSGLLAVQNTIVAMNTLREQIQETSKRIKRLGESSQEISEITEIIAAITEQTHVLALNAAIQAASAGEAGRGFSVVAEEVQRLAVRSGEATQQISSLIQTIQGDALSAIEAMERSAQGVVSSANLSDSAGVALTDIDRISRKVADQVEKISETALREAALASEVAKSIQSIFITTEKTEKVNLSTAAEVQRLSLVAHELRRSVARFKVR